MFFFASHPEAEIDTKTSGRGFSSVALRGFFYLALGCVLPKTDPDFQIQTPESPGKNRSKRSSTKENVQIGFGNTFDCVVKSAYLATSEPCLATSNRSFKTRWLHLFLSSKYVRGQKRVSFDHLGFEAKLRCGLMASDTPVSDTAGARLD